MPEILIVFIQNIGLFLGLFLGLLTVICLGLMVDWVVRKSTEGIIVSPPEGIDKEEWEKATSNPSDAPGKWLGYLERFVFFFAIWVKAYVLIIAWLAFKVASKWEIWSNVIKPPDKLEIDNVKQLDYFAARHRWGSRIYQRFLVGTITNLLIAILGFLIGQGIIRFFRFFGEFLNFIIQNP